MNCPDDTQIALFVNGDLSVEEVSRFEAHLDQCERCLALIAQAADTTAAGSLDGNGAGSKQDSVFVHLLAAFVRRSDQQYAVEPTPARERFGRYRVLGVLGRGAMGIVYRAVDDETGRSVAIKTVARPSPKLLAAIRQEIAFLERERHPGIVPIFESGVVDGDPWFAMELLRGLQLDDFNRTLWRGRHNSARRSGARALTETAVSSAPKGAAAGGRLEDALTLFARVCAPLGFIHREGIVHCDLKPANIFIRENGQPVLMDFGLLTRAGGAIGRESLEVGGHLRGTLPYLAPELIRGQIADARADLYALGCLLYETVTGRPPFVASTANGYLEAHLHAEPRLASQLVSDVPRKLDDLLAALLAKHPAKRIGAAEVVEQMLTHLLQTPDSAPRSSSSSLPYLFRPRMVGREAVVEQILECRADVERGRGRVVLVSGESGIGKTFLASEISQRLARTGFDVVTGECVPVAAREGGAREVFAAALEPFRRLIQNAADRCRGEPPGSALRFFGSERSIALLARYEPTLIRLLSNAADDVAPLPPNAERDRVLQALSDLVERLAAETPLLVVIDDLQWADDLSLALLEALSESDLTGKRLLLIALYRSEEVSKPIVELEKKAAVRALRLERLDSAALTVLVGDLLSDTPPEGFIQALAAHSEGNPFFVAEYLRAGAAEGLLQRTPEGWRLATSAVARGYEAITLPRSLQDLLERRLAALTIETQRIAETGAVLGREFPVSMVAAVAGVVPDKLTRNIDEMLERQVVQRVPGDNLRFHHDKTREAAYARLDAVRRVGLHGAAANVIEATYKTRPDFPGHYAELAYHLREGGEAVRAIDYLEKAASHALATSANADAVRLFREARDLSTRARIHVPPNREARWERQLGEALLGLGDMAASVEHLRGAVSMLRTPMPERALPIALGIAANTAKQLVHRMVPLAWLRANRGNAELLEVARAYEHLLQGYYYSGDYKRLLLANLTTINLAERQKPSPTLAAAYTNAAITASIIPLQRVAHAYFALAEKALSNAKEPHVESYLRLVRGVHLAGLGRWEEALESNRKALALADKLGFRRRWEEAAGVRTWSLLCRAMFAEGIDWSNRLVESASRRGDRHMLSWGFLARAFEYARQGDLGGIQSTLDRYGSILPGLAEPELIRTAALRLVLAVETGKLNEAEPLVDNAADLIRRTGPIHLHCIDAYAHVADARLLFWKRTKSGGLGSAEHERARIGLSTLGRAANIFPVARPRYLLLKGAYQNISGHPDKAISLWNQGLTTARKLGMPYEQACCQRAIADHLPRGSTEAGVASEEAHALFTTIGARESRPWSISV